MPKNENKTDNKESFSKHLKLSIVLLVLYILSWVGVLTVPFIGFEKELQNDLTSLFLLIEEIMLLVCVVVIVPVFVADLRNTIKRK